MDIASVIGLLLGLFAIIGGQALEGGHLKSILEPTAALIVFGGTIGATMISYPLKEFLLGLKMAKSAFKTCLDYSIKFQYFDEFSRTCEVWLSKNYGAEYHLVDEFRGAASRVNSGMSDKAQPLNMDGTAFIAVSDAPAPADKPADKPAK